MGRAQCLTEAVEPLIAGTHAIVCDNARLGLGALAAAPKKHGYSMTQGHPVTHHRVLIVRLE